MKSLVESIMESRLGKGWKQERKDGYLATFLPFEEPSELYGIDGGKISKLEIRKGRVVVCNYDRGWDIEPTKDVKDFYDEIIKKYN